MFDPFVSVGLVRCWPAKKALWLSTQLERLKSQDRENIGQN